MQVLVTGGAGFIGSNLVGHLLKKGHQVTVVDNLITGQIENVEQFSNTAGFEFINCGIESAEFPELFAKTMRPFERIYNLACPTGVPNIEILGDEILAACSTGTRNVLNLAAEMGAKFLLTSSSEIYGQPEVFPQAENYSGNVNPLSARANYEEGKRFSETLVQRFVKTRGVEGKIVRLFNVYGPNMRLEDSRVVSRFVTQALQGKPLTVHGDGSQRRTLCYVSEIVAGLELVMEKGTAGKAYNLGSDQEITIFDLAKLIVEITDSTSEITFIERPDHDHNSRWPALKEIAALGWERRIDLRDGLCLALEYFQTHLGSNKQTETIETQACLLPYINPEKA